MAGIAFALRGHKANHGACVEGAPRQRVTIQANTERYLPARLAIFRWWGVHFPKATRFYRLNKVHMWIVAA